MSERLVLTETVAKSTLTAADLNIDHLHEVISAYGMSSKNVYNGALYIIRNLHFSYSYNKDTQNFHCNIDKSSSKEDDVKKTEIIDFANSIITKLNIEK